MPKTAENFNLTIRFGNDAMQSPADVARSLRKLADRFGDIDGAAMSGEDGRILDLNGNDVGGWEFA